MREEQLGKFRYQGGGFPLGGDSLQLGKFATVRSGFRVCDLGTGAGLLLLLLADRIATLTLTGIEIDAVSAEIGRENLARNGLQGDIITADLRDRSCLRAGAFDLVISNPPYFATASGGVASGMRSEVDCTLDDLCAAASRLLKNGGRFAVVHRPERLVDLFCTMRSHQIEPKRMKFIAHSPSHPPSAVLVEGVRQGGVGLVIEG